MSSECTSHISTFRNEIMNLQFDNDHGGHILHSGNSPPMLPSDIAYASMSENTIDIETESTLLEIDLGVLIENQYS